MTLSLNERAAALADRLRGDPSNLAVALELADVLARLASR
jgi:hypothetical protein